MAPQHHNRRAFLAGRASRPGGLAFRHQRLRHYLHESGRVRYRPELARRQGWLTLLGRNLSALS